MKQAFAQFSMRLVMPYAQSRKKKEKQNKKSKSK